MLIKVIGSIIFSKAASYDFLSALLSKLSSCVGCVRTADRQREGKNISTVHFLSGTSYASHEMSLNTCKKRRVEISGT